MRNKIWLALVLTVAGFGSMAEETPPPRADEKAGPIKASQTEVRKEATTTTTQDAQRQTDRAPTNDRVTSEKKELPEYDSQGANAKENAKRDAQGVKGEKPTSKSVPGSIPEYDSDGATKKENDRRNKEK